MRCGLNLFSLLPGVRADDMETCVTNKSARGSQSSCTAAKRESSINHEIADQEHRQKTLKKQNTIKHHKHQAIEFRFMTHATQPSTVPLESVTVQSPHLTALLDSGALFVRGILDEF